jgi:nicotinamide-nucleotide amidase
LEPATLAHPRAAILLSGSELLDGRLRDRNGHRFAASLAARGVRVSHLLAAPDDLDVLVDDLRFLLAGEPDVLLVSGGLGTTHDDLTSEAVARALGRDLVEDPDARRMVEERLADVGRRRGIDTGPLLDQALKQARLPQGSRALPPGGVAPGFALREGATRLYALPGPPTEIDAMWPPILDELEAEGLFPSAVRRTVRIYGSSEMQLVPLLERHRHELLDLAVTASDGELTVVVGYRFDVAAQVQGDALVLALEAGAPVFSSDGRTVDELLADELRASGATVSVAESCTGGLLGGRLTERPGSSDYVLGGVISYANEIKERVLGVEARLLRDAGAVSPEVARAMAEGVRRLTGSTYALSITGIAGPAGGAPEKPVGLVYHACASPHGTTVRRDDFPGSREAVRRRAVVAALHHLLEAFEA